MKTIRRILIALAAPATVLLAITQLGGTPISKGHNTGFLWKSDFSSPGRLTLSVDAGDLTCWLRLRLPATNNSLSAALSNGGALSIYEDGSDGSDYWLAIVAEGQKREEKFKWPAGASVIVSSSNGNPASLALSDWRVFLSDKEHDSKDRARWRRMVFLFSIALLGFALLGGSLEAYSKLTEPPVLTSQRCIEELIKSTEGTNSRETKWMQSILTKVLLHGMPAADALAPLPLTSVRKRALWFRARSQFLSRLERLIIELQNYLSYL